MPRSFFPSSRIAFVVLLIPLFFLSSNCPAEDFSTIFNGKNLENWTNMHGLKCRVDEKAGALLLADGVGWLRSDRRYSDFVLEFESQALRGNDHGTLFFQAGLDGVPWPKERYEISLKGQYPGKLMAGGEVLANSNSNPITQGEWARWRLTVQGAYAQLTCNDVQLLETDALKPGSGAIGFQAIDIPYAYRNIRIQELGYTNLLAGKEPVGDHLVVHHGSPELWSVRDDGVLVCKGEGGGWIGTRKNDYGDFDLKLDFRVPLEGNSGVFIRCPFDGNPAYAGMEIQILDDDAKHWGPLEPWQKTGSIYHEVAPSVRATKKGGTWQNMEIVCNNNIVQIYVNGVQIIDADLDKYTTSTTDALPLKDRPRSGYIGLQNYGIGIEFRNMLVKRLSK